MFETVKTHPAVVARTLARMLGAEEYLVMTEKGAAWTSDETTATRFASIREANRMALRLAGADRAFGLPASGLH